MVCRGSSGRVRPSLCMVRVLLLGWGFLPEFRGVSGRCGWGLWGVRGRAHSRKRRRDSLLRQLLGLSGKNALPSSDSPAINARPCAATPSFPARADGHDTAVQATPAAASSRGLLFPGLETLLAPPLIVARRMDPKISGTCANDTPGSRANATRIASWRNSSECRFGITTTSPSQSNTCQTSCHRTV